MRVLHLLMYSEEADFHVCTLLSPYMLSFIFTLMFFIFETSWGCFHVSVSASAFLPADRMMKHFIFASEDRSDLQTKPQHLCVKVEIFIKPRFIWSKPQDVRSHSVPISWIAH